MIYLLIFALVDFIIMNIAAHIVRKRNIKKPYVYMNLIIIKQAVFLDDHNKLQHLIII